MERFTLLAATVCAALTTGSAQADSPCFGDMTLEEIRIKLAEQTPPIQDVSQGVITNHFLGHDPTQWMVKRKAAAKAAGCAAAAALALNGQPFDVIILREQAGDLTLWTFDLVPQVKR